MSSDNLLEKVKKLREITGVGFKDCKSAIDETGGDIDKSIDLLESVVVVVIGSYISNKHLLIIAIDLCSSLSKSFINSL